ncbi:PH domain-containing protein [Lentilactobacillus sp. IMAU92037]|uniref:PH domain-containing protein n=1 Tax=Lentilactobacillus TaxID=2767893 RepID=UPI001C27A968|nr:PH domain-containing protein [Lentilactobacillus sp. TOM.63]MBU9788855.1 PH domain-containing protein [Lentilactobacillus dabitei]MBV0929613.1 PH domain-containing protein [Lentilactobacillus dabitei]MDM7515757.1 PH domain-containing protein [Lentilactobacillus sp. TOM.63]
MTSETKHHLNPLSMFYFLFHRVWDWIIYVILTVGPLTGLLKHFHINPVLGFGALLVLIIMLIVVRYLCFTFEIAADMLTINSGIFIKKHTHIPYGRIQTIQRSQWFFLKPFKLEKLQIETAGHDDKTPEAVLPLVPESVRTAIEARRVTGPEAKADLTGTDNQKTAESATTYVINPHELNVFALTSLGILPLIGVLLALYGKIQEAIPQRVINSVTSEIVHQSLIIIVVVGILIILISIAGSYLSIVQRYYKFTLTAQTNQLKTYQGLFQRNSVTIPTDRIQALRIKQNVIRQWCKISTVQALAASSAGDDEKSNDLMILPVVNTQTVFKTLRPFIDWTPTQAVALNRLKKAPYWYFIRNAMLFAAVPIVICVYFFTVWGLLSLALLPIAIFLGWYSASNTGWVVSGDQLIMQVGHSFTRSQYVIPKKNVQSFSLHQSIWMSARELAHLEVNVRHGNHNQNIEIRYLPKEAAQEIFDWLKN